MEARQVDPRFRYQRRQAGNEVQRASAMEHVRSVRPDATVVEVDTSHLLLQTDPQDAW